jgi:hypothetical protein
MLEKILEVNVPIARPISTKMKVNLIQKEARRIRYSRKRMPRRWYSAQAKMAEMMYPTLWRMSAMVEAEGAYRHT